MCCCDGMSKQRKSVFNQIHILFPAQGKWSGTLTVHTRHQRAIFKTWIHQIFSCTSCLSAISFTRCLWLSSYRVFPSAAECIWCWLPEQDPQPGGCTCSPAPWPASPAHHPPPPDSPQVQEACQRGLELKAWRAMSLLCAGSCRTAAGAWPRSPRTERAAAERRRSWLWGFRGWREGAQQSPRREQFVTVAVWKKLHHVFKPLSHTHSSFIQCPEKKVNILQ